MFRKFCYLIIILINISSPVIADDVQQSSTRQWLSSVVSDYERALCHGNLELYLPVYTWHNRATYDRDNIDGYNEIPYGIGIGKYYFDEKGNLFSVYAMEFQESHNEFEPIVGVAWQKVWNVIDEFSLSAGYTAFFTARSDYFDYIPFPGVLPLLSATYNKLSLSGTYVPGLKRNVGNVAFFWLSYKL